MSSVLSQGPPFRLRSGESWRDPFPRYDELREHAPAHHVREGDYWVLSRWSDVIEAAKDTATYSSTRGLTVEYDDLAAAGLDEIARLGAAGGGDVAHELFKPLPSFVVAHYLGVPAEDRERFDRWTDLIVAAGAGDGVHAAGDAVAELFEYFSALVERRRTDPGDDVVSELVGSVDPDVPVLRILGFAFTMVAGGNDTVTGLLGGAAELLTEHSDQRDLLAAPPDLLPDAVEELLRVVSPVQGLARTLLARARWTVRILVSLLATPEPDPSDERVLVEQFLAPVVLRAKAEPTTSEAARSAVPG